METFLKVCGVIFLIVTWLWIPVGIVWIIAKAAEPKTVVVEKRVVNVQLPSQPQPKSKVERSPAVEKLAAMN